MRHATKVLIAVVAGLLCLAADTPKHAPVSWEDCKEGVITGRLGIPLGTVCEIKGVVDKIDQLTKGEPEDDVKLRITTLDGTTLKTPIVIRMSDNVVGLKPRPKAGEKFSYTVYETGYFSGRPTDPRGLLPKQPAVQTNIASYQLLIRMNVLTPVEN